MNLHDFWHEIIGPIFIPANPKKIKKLQDLGIREQNACIIQNVTSLQEILFPSIRFEKEQKVSGLSTCGLWLFFSGSLVIPNILMVTSFLKSICWYVCYYSMLTLSCSVENNQVIYQVWKGTCHNTTPGENLDKYPKLIQFGIKVVQSRVKIFHIGFKGRYRIPARVDRAPVGWHLVPYLKSSHSICGCKVVLYWNELSGTVSCSGVIASIGRKATVFLAFSSHNSLHMRRSSSERSVMGRQALLVLASTFVFVLRFGNSSDCIKLLGCVTRMSLEALDKDVLQHASQYSIFLNGYKKHYSLCHHRQGRI